MSEHTPIQWCDSTVNAQMGCDGCELWAPARHSCYAGVMTTRQLRQEPRVGWPRSFEEPAIFPGRIARAAAKWRDLRDVPRPGKPWLDGLPRVIFLNDMGDTFTESLPLDWLAPELPAIAASPHLHLILTKRPHRALAFFAKHRAPANVWVGTSITGRHSVARARLLRDVPAPLRFLSIEPLTDWPAGLSLEGLGWVIIGGESGAGARRCDLGWVRSLLALCRDWKVPAFVKQLGARPAALCERCSARGRGFCRLQGATIARDGFEGHGMDGMLPVPLGDAHGGEWTEWPEDLRVREMPAW